MLRLATIYDLVEMATAVKPLLLKALLADAEQAAYLDPDTYVTSPMVELSPDLDATDGGILLTPHFLDPVPPGAELTEGHLLTVGVYNLGFCAVDRRALRRSSTGGGGTSSTSASGTRCPGCSSTRSGATSGR